MGSAAKTLKDFFQPTPKRLKVSASDSPPKKTHLNNNNNNNNNNNLSTDQILRIRLNKLRANSKRNLNLCLQLVSKSKRYVKLEELLVGKTWLEALPGELQKPYAKSLCKFVEKEICSSNGSVEIYPPQHLIFNALNSTPFDNVKVVIIGQDPYHGPGQAMGLSFSVPHGIKVPSSLVNIFKELNKDLACSIPSHGNLQNWALQGVLLLNTVLTVRSHQANSHAKKGWEQFTDSVIRSISQKNKGVVFLLWGNSAQEKSKLIDGTRHHILKAAHPSGLSANRGFFGCRHFSKANQLLEQMGTPLIDWQL